MRDKNEQKASQCNNFIMHQYSSMQASKSKYVKVCIHFEFLFRGSRQWQAARQIPHGLRTELPIHPSI